MNTFKNKLFVSKNYLSLLKVMMVMTLFVITSSFATSKSFAQSGEKWSFGLNSPTGNYGFGTNNAAAIIFKTNGVSQMWLSPIGNLGIGVNNSNYKLAVNGQTHLYGFTLLDSNLTVLQNITANTITANSLANNGIKLVTADATGTFTPFAFGQANEVLYGNGVWGSIPQQSHWVQTGNNIYYNHGFVGIGTNNPMWDLDVIGDVRISNNLYVGGGIVITEKVQANVKVNTASLEADSIIMDSTKAFYGLSTFKDAVRLDNKLDVQGNVSVTGNLNSTGNSQVNGNFILGSMTGSNGLAYIDSTGTLKIIPGTVLSLPGGPLVPHLLLNEYWNTTGNAGLSGSSNFIGTTDNVPFIIRTNNTEKMRVSQTGDVGIGTSTLAAKFTVEGDKITLKENSNTLTFDADNAGGVEISSSNNVIKFITGTNYNTLKCSKLWAETEVKVQNTDPWPDFVFDKEYNLMTLSEIENYIKINKHLPNVPSSADVEKDGISLGKMDATLLQKIEELTLYVIDLKKENDVLQKVNEDLGKRVNALERER